MKDKIKSFTALISFMMIKKRCIDNKLENQSIHLIKGGGIYNCDFHRIKSGFH